MQMNRREPCRISLKLIRESPLSPRERWLKYTVQYGYKGSSVARVRTDEKRREIVKAAQELFEEHGFDRTSMSMISERVGGSKATLYGYFRSKEEILSAVLVYDVTEEADRLMNEILAAPNLRDGLVKLGFAYMMRRLA